MTTNRRVRLADLVRRRAGGEITSMSAADIAEAQATHPGHDPVRDRIFGAVARGVDISEQTLDARSGPLRVRLYSPTGRTPRGTVVNFHGGGWVLGDLDGNDWTCSTVAARTGALVVSVDYRLAPAHRFPAATEDCLDATRWAAEQPSSAAGVVVMGDSAGGNLAAVTALACRDAGVDLALQVLLYPGTDLTKQSDSLVVNADAPFLTRAAVDAFTDHYLGPDGDPRDPRASPLFAPDLSGLAPALVVTAEHDAIRDDGSRYAAALRAAGVDVRHTDVAGAPHGFFSVPGLVPQAREVLAEVCGAVAAALGTEPTPAGRTRTVSGSVVVAASPAELYALVSDPTRMHRWSPENTGATGSGSLPVGAVFDGTNRRGRASWVTRSTVTAAEPGVRFAFRVHHIGVGRPVVPGRIATWEYRFEAVDGGTRVTETWTDDRPWPDAVAAAFDRVATGTTFAAFQRRNIDRTLARLKADVEGVT